MNLSMEPINNTCNFEGCPSRAKWTVKGNGVTVGQYCLQHGNRTVSEMSKPPAKEKKIKEAKSA